MQSVRPSKQRVDMRRESECGVAAVTRRPHSTMAESNVVRDTVKEQAVGCRRYKTRVGKFWEGDVGFKVRKRRASERK